MPKETPVVVGTDPIEIIGQQRAVRTSRGEPRVVEMSTVDCVVTVQHAYDLGCAQLYDHGGGTPGPTIYPRTGDTLFRVKHGLSAVPTEVYPHRISNEIGFQGTNNNSKYGMDDEVPDYTGYSGFNPVRYRNTTTNGSVLVATCEPYADEQYSYFTVCFPITLWSVVVRGDAVGNAEVEVPEYCGIVLSATAQPWGALTTHTVNVGIVIGDNYGGITPTTACSTSGTAGTLQMGYPNHENRIVRVVNNAEAEKDYLVNAFCAPRNASKVRVRVISRVWENVSAPRIVISPSSDAQPMN